jgi:3-hydroxyisobutyrate dehydrogenase-like beta-hydroxyacid dehydrogenase
MENRAMSKIAFIGLGVMGYPMAAHLQAGGHEVTVYNRTAARANAWLAEHAVGSAAAAAATPAAAAKGADYVMTCVGNDDDLRAVVLGEQGVLASMANGAVLIDHTTASAEVARELAGVAAMQGVSFVDAPVSGGQQGAENGALTIMCGGTNYAFSRAAKVMQPYAKAITHLGPVGAGQLTKMVNQICVAGVVQGLAEGMNFAAKAGLDVQQVIDAISQGAASSWQMVNRHRSMIAGEYEHGFAIDWMRKDLDICLAEAANNGSDLTITAQINQYYRELQESGGGRWDTSALLKRLQQ